MRGASLLFDLDGTLADTDHIHFQAFRDLMGAEADTLTWDLYKAEIMGQPNTAIFARLFPGRDPEHESLADAKEATFRSRLGRLDPTPGAVRLLDWADTAGVPSAIVTNAPRENADAMLAALGLADRFREIVIGPECARPKPDPMPYIVAMERLGADPAQSIAFEDSRSGARAAVASGARTFGLRTALADADLRAVGVFDTLADFNDPALWQTLDALAGAAPTPSN